MTKHSEATALDVMYVMPTTSVSEPATGITTTTNVMANVSAAHSGASQDVIAMDSVVKAPNKLLS